jgi:hypothetical protein
VPTEIRQHHLFTRQNYAASDYLALVSMIAVALAVVFAPAGTAFNLGWAWAFFAVTLTIAGCALIASAIVDHWARRCHSFPALSSRLRA